MVLAVIVYIKCTPGKRDELLEVFDALGKWVQANEPAYQACIDPKDPDSVVMIERYTDKNAIAIHSGSALGASTSAIVLSRGLGKITSMHAYPETKYGFTSRM